MPIHGNCACRFFTRSSARPVARVTCHSEEWMSIAGLSQESGARALEGMPAHSPCRVSTASQLLGSDRPPNFARLQHLARILRWCSEHPAKTQRVGVKQYRQPGANLLCILLCFSDGRVNALYMHPPHLWVCARLGFDVKHISQTIESASAYLQHGLG